MTDHIKNAKKDAKEAVNQTEVDASHIPDAAKKAAQELRAEAQDLREEAEREFDELKDDGTIDKYRNNVTEFLRAASDRVSAVSACWASKAKQASYSLLTELQNPVVIANVALGAGLVSSLLRGYAKYHTRYLKGKSDAVIISTVGGATAFLALDVFLSSKYYSKFDKKKL
ncbi:LANO_0F02344g1_1 [Lachancea nothofagi CBS 11611]|uniref:LANO_0F02344g1_1 n=1 Tax=Lachancea nothofagi CBS 11611 TaxID=1266666 RepID=A0A1G4K6S4_9SACH|nr:LANO_0F02344g1_1 [Lachancea nothofagi CBS 11611]